jgi:hypothetical protein
MASDTIEQMAEKIRTFAEDLIRDNFAPRVDTPAPFHAGQTVDAAAAWEAMGQGWEVQRYNGVSRKGDYYNSYMNGDGLAAWSDGNTGTLSKEAWSFNFRAYTFTLIRIHPAAHQHALQRLLAAGLKVGSRVEVVNGWEMGGGGFDIPQSDAPINCVGRVTGVDNVGVVCECGDTCGIYPAHCLRLLPAEQDAPAPNPEDQVPPATTTGEGVRVPEPTKWCVWSREAGPPSVKHDTHAEAKAEAERLAAKHPGREFKVLGQVGENVVADPPPRFKKGDRVVLEAVVTSREPDIDGDWLVACAGCGMTAKKRSEVGRSFFAAASALRPAKGVGE